MYDLIVAKNNKRLTKKIIILLIIFMIISVICIAVVYERINDRQDYPIEEVKSNTKIFNCNKIKDIMIELYKNSLPELTDTTYENIKTIYSSDYKRVFLTFDDRTFKINYTINIRCFKTK